LRVVDLSDSTDYSVSAFYQSSQQDGNLTYSMIFGSEAVGDPTVRLVTGQFNAGIDFTLQGAGSSYHLFELIYDPSAGSADLFADGVERLSDYTGFVDSDGYSRVQWGSAQSDMTGHGNYNLVQFSVVPEPISSLLFVGGGTLLAGRRYIKRRKKA
jgi:hypothetical protein